MHSIEIMWPTIPGKMWNPTRHSSDRWIVVAYAHVPTLCRFENVESILETGEEKADSLASVHGRIGVSASRETKHSHSPPQRKNWR